MRHAQVSEMLTAINKAIARCRAQQADRRKPENSHLRTLWDAKHRAAEAGDWTAYDKLEATIKLYKDRPETAVDAAECDPARSIPHPILTGKESPQSGRGRFINHKERKRA